LSRAERNKARALRKALVETWAENEKVTATFELSDR